MLCPPAISLYFLQYKYGSNTIVHTPPCLCFVFDVALGYVKNSGEDMRKKTVSSGENAVCLCVPTVLGIELSTFSLTLSSGPILSKQFWSSLSKLTLSETLAETLRSFHLSPWNIWDYRPHQQAQSCLFLLKAMHLRKLFLKISSLYWVSCDFNDISN